MKVNLKRCKMAFISTVEDNKLLSLTIYQNNFGLVKEKRELNLSKLEDTIFFLNVPEKIEVNSIMFENLEVYEVNYDYNIINKRNLLESYIGKEVTIHDYQLDKKISGILLNSDNGYIIQENKSKEVYLVESGQLIFDDLPNKFLLKPTLLDTNLQNIGKHKIMKNRQTITKHEYKEGVIL